MFIHIGLDKVIRSGDVLGIFDLDNTTVSKTTRDYLAFAQKNGQITDVCTDLPKSFVVCSGKKNEQTVYITQLNTSTLLKRAKPSKKSL
ncbi:MAG: DUF370 domain-containing protein [Clostridia bacterium]|nr:DUF370 domain-containing protein [Clostridia bacterium]